MSKKRALPADRQIAAGIDGLRKRVAELERMLGESVSHHEHRTEINVATKAGFDAGHRDGMHEGAFTALCPAHPEHSNARLQWVRFENGEDEMFLWPNQERAA
jgi:hypothetical protein